jgi:hypothetical protein
MEAVDNNHAEHEQQTMHAGSTREDASASITVKQTQERLLSRCKVMCEPHVT